MVARSAATLSFSSVQHRDPPLPPPAPSPDPRSKISSFAHDTITTATKTTSNSSTITTRRNALTQHQLQNKLHPVKQSKLPFSLSPPLASSARPSPRPPPPQHLRQTTKTIPAHERPFKKAKLDGRHHHGQASITGPAKLPLRSRDSQGLLTPEPTATSTSAASRTRSATGTITATTPTTNNRGKTTTLAAPPRLPLSSSSLSSSSPASAITRTTRKSAHSQHHPPVAVSEDVEKKLNGVMFRDNDNDDDKNNKIINLKNANATAFEIGGGGGDDAHNNNLLKDRTSPSTVIGREKRSLRSNDGGSRSKSELAMYFQNYEQILSLEPVKPDFLSADTTVLLIDDLAQPIILDPTPTNAPAAKLRGKQDKNLTNGHVAQSGMDNPLLELHDAQIIDLRLPANSSRKPSKDPLDDDVYFKAHRRIERQEKQLRNIERERAQHEKVQLDRLLDELQGHDWLRVMGISGITETEKKLYEPKRAYFIKEVSALIEKFRVWKEEERRRKTERDQNLADEGNDEDEDEEDDNEENETEDEDEDEDEEAADQSSMEEEDTGSQPNGELDPFSPNFQTYGEPPDINDVDAWAARQLHQEAISASSNTARHNNLLPKHHSISCSSSSSSSSSSPTSTSTSYPAPAGRDSDRAARAPSPATTHTSAPAPTPPPRPEAQPFTSFYTKRHLRDAAVGKIRRGRTRTAGDRCLPEEEEAVAEGAEDLM
ncbi:hypothetical protein EMCG_00355 [[Emmonsia] crescens]|uniref:Something about silencing protein 4 domain-containing protein n=1 Tax=[Emmonsia] crescens TaxID=73230 RepID=A0A0G2HWN9_9EURO|nr:hypothetical protein EMCG_00355 [Emmonsia crescens UAMH 3008]